MNVDLSEDISQEAVKLSSRQESYFSDGSLSLSVPDPHPDNKKGKLAFGRHPPNNQHINDSVFDIELSKSQGSGYHREIWVWNMMSLLR